MTTAAAISKKLDRLGSDLDGRLVRPGDPAWDTARAAWQLTVDQQPTAVVLAGSVADVVTTVRAAAEKGLQVAVQNTGHGAAPLGPLDHTLLLRTAALAGVTIDPERRLARVEAGALWGQVTDAAATHRLAALAGSARDVGVVGYTLGGGLSWLARSHGLAANDVVAVDLVTADGRLQRVDETHFPDLFWAVRGGGGSFGVVTALEIRLHAISEVNAGALFWPIERAAEVLHAWREWLPVVPDEVTTIGRILRLPPLLETPEPLRGRSLVTIELASTLGTDQTVALLAPLLALRPEFGEVRRRPVAELGELHRDPPSPTPATGDGMALSALPLEALDAYLAVVGPGTDSPLLTSELRQLGGALTPGRRRGGAVSGLDAAFVVFSAGITPDPGSAANTAAALRAIHTALAPWVAPWTNLNVREKAVDPSELFDALTLRRLREIHAAHDPHHLFRANHPVHEPIAL